MTAPHIAVILNPIKGDRAKLERTLDRVVKAAGGEHPRVTWWETTADDAGQGAAGRAIGDGATVVVAAGGDGTVRAVAEHLALTNSGVEMGILPLGTGNLLARNLGIPRNSAAQAFSRVVSGSVRDLDLGWIEAWIDGSSKRQGFVVLAGFGVDAHMITETDDDLKSRVGWLAYVESLGRAVDASEVLEFDLSINGEQSRTAKGHTLLIGNCGTLQGGITLLPDADPSDGKLDYLLLSAEGIGQWFDTLRSVVWDNGIKRVIGLGTKAESGETSTHGQATTLEVTLSEPRVLQIDGEDVGEMERFSIELQPSAIRVRT